MSQSGWDVYITSASAHPIGTSPDCRSAEGRFSTSAVDWGVFELLGPKASCPDKGFEKRRFEELSKAFDTAVSRRCELSANPAVNMIREYASLLGDGHGDGSHEYHRLPLSRSGLWKLVVHETCDHVTTECILCHNFDND